MPALLLYCIGMPVWVFLLLWKAGEKRHERHYVLMLGFLMMGYNDHVWCVCVVGRLCPVS